jgi:hypothetical protein
MHEPFDTLVELEWHPSRRDLRSFGIVAAIVCSTVAFAFAHSAWPDRASSGTLRSCLLAAAVVCFILALVRPAWLRPFYLLLTCVTFPMRWLVAWASCSHRSR